jgi:hypothetical protein
VPPERRTGPSAAELLLGTGRDAEEGVSAAIYGSIVVTGLIAALNAEDASLRVTFLTVVSTMAVFWLAHVWSEVVGERIVTRREVGWARARVLARREWPFFEAAGVPSFALVLAWIGLYNEEAGVDIALALAILQLVGWGATGARRMRADWHMSLLVGLVDGALGLGIVLLEVALH